MLKADLQSYDAIIIGAGISGLVCGCYLAKAGMKVLIAEQHHQPGGYCTSFKRKGFTFDAAAHSFGSYREGGAFRKAIQDLGIDQRVVIKRYDPIDIIITPDMRITFWTDQERTIKAVEDAFPNEHRIREFFSFMGAPRPADIAALRRKTFQDLLDHYFSDKRLKAILAFPVFGNGGLPPSLMSAFTGSKIFTEFIIDGGYYPDGGMQALSNALAQQFRNFGGTLLLSSLVTRILVDQKRVSGVELKSQGLVYSRYVISNGDARQTFLTLLREVPLDQQLTNKLKTMTPSLSMFIIYLGIDDYFSALPQPGSTLWYLPHYNIEEMYRLAKMNLAVDLTKYLCRVSPNRNAVLAMSNTSYKDEQYWIANKTRLLDDFIETIEKTAIPELSRHIVFKEAATPHTLQRYTLNDEGAAYGWESTREQFLDPEFRKPSFLSGLYLTGHWTTFAQGLAGVVYLGHDLSDIILRRAKHGNA
jgi:phytoene dehydrogenase-like protein